MTLEVRQCRAFLAVVEQGSLGRAAESTHVTQPALSRTLAEMERRLGHALFERHARGMTLTAAGQALLPYARLIAFETRAAERALDELGGLKRGTVHVGAVGTIVRGLLPRVVRDLLRAAPDVTVRVVEQPDDRLQLLLQDREIDLAIGAAVPSCKQVTEIGICRHDDLFTVFAAADHPLASVPANAGLIDAVLRERWVMPLNGATPRAMFLATLAAAGRAPPRIAVETTSHDAMVGFVASTRLLGWLPRALLIEPLAAGLVREITVPELGVRRRFRVLQRTGAPLPPACCALLELLPLDTPASVERKAP